MKLFTFPIERRLKKFAKESAIAVTKDDLHGISKKFSYSHDEVVQLYLALPVENRNKAYLELLLKTSSRGRVSIQALILTIREK